MEKKQIKDLWGWLNEITLHKTPVENISEESWNIWNSWLVNKYVSMDIQYIELVNYVQTIPYDSKKQIYQIYREMIPKRKTFFKYLKTNRKKRNNELADYIAKYFECSLGEADEYIDLLRKNGVTSILHEMGVDEKEIKKLLKA
jgi:hypothetical protein